MDEILAERYQYKFYRGLSTSQQRTARRLLDLDLLRAHPKRADPRNVPGLPFTVSLNFQIVHVFKCNDDDPKVSGWSAVDESGKTWNGSSLSEFRDDSIIGKVRMGVHPQRCEQLDRIIGPYNPDGDWRVYWYAKKLRE